MDFDTIESKIVKQIAEDNQLPDIRVKEVVSSFYKAVRDKIIGDEPAHIRIPFLGTFDPNSKFKRTELEGTKTDNSG